MANSRRTFYLQELDRALLFAVQAKLAEQRGFVSLSSVARMAIRAMARDELGDEEVARIFAEFGSANVREFNL